MCRVLPRHGLAGGIDRGGRPVIEIGIYERDDAGGRIYRRTIGHVWKFTGHICQDRASSVDDRGIVGSRENNRHLLG